MKISMLLYTVGLILIAASIMLIVLGPGTNRTLLIAGDLAFIGFPLNIAGYVMKKTKANRVKVQS